jgi:uncharacterized protein (DUF1697 family)
MKTFIILLRGITPVGKNKVLMAPLREALTKAGLKNVQTYIQSGNIVAQAGLTQIELERAVHDVIHKNFGGDIAVLARTPDQFSDIMKHNPFREEDGKRLYFTLLATAPDKQRLKEFLSTDFSPDQVRYLKNTIYSLYATKYSDSKFNNNYFERKLKVAATTRNLNTMTKLVDISIARQSAPAGAKKRRGQA